MKKFYLFIFLAVMANNSFSQIRKKSPGFNGVKSKSGVSQFLEQQWWLGFKGGVNQAQADPTKRYSIITPTNYSSTLAEKKYTAYKEIGIQTSLELTYYYKGFYFSLQPGYISSTYSYTNTFNWYDENNPTSKLTQNFNQDQKVEYINLPLILKYDITGSKLRPFIQVGIFYSSLINATKSVSSSGIDQASGGTNNFTSETLTVGAQDLYSSYWGLMGGAGVAYQLGNVRLGLEVSYQQSMSNIVNPQNRFSNDRLAGIGDVQDDLNLKNIIISTGILFPMRYLSNSFKSNDR